MGRYDEERKKLGISTTTTKSQTTKVNTSSRYDNERKKLYEEPQKQSALAAMRAPTALPQNSTQKMANLMSSPMPKNLISSKTTDKKENTLPYVNTYKEVPKNLSSGNILGGIGNALKGTGQMVLEGLQGPQKLVLNASKAIIDTTKGKKPSFDTNISTESYLKDTGNADTEKFYKTTGGKIASGVLGVASDPLTWVGGGIASDAAKARKVGTAGLLNDAKIGQKASSKVPLYLDDAVNNSKNGKVALTPIVKPISQQGKFTVKNQDYESAANDYNNAIETIQNHFGTNELRTNEIPRIKSELGIDLDSIINRMEVSEKGVKLPNSNTMGLKRSAGVASDKSYNLSSTLKNQPSLPKELPRAANKNVAVNIDNGSSMLNVPVGKQAKIVTSNLDNASQFRTNTIERSTMIPDGVKAKLTPKEFDYIPETSKAWQDTAIKNVSTNRTKVMDDIKQASSISGGIQAHEAAVVTSQLLDEVKQTGNVSALKSWLKTVSEKTRETARALKGTDTAWDKKSAEGALTDAQRVVDKIERDTEKVNPNLIKKINEETKRRVKEFTDLGKTVNPDEIRDIVKRDYKVPTLTDNDVKFIVDNMDKAKTFEDGSYQQRMLHTKVAQRIAEKIPSTGLEKFQAAQRISMLLNPKSTVVRNPLGNKLLGTLENVKKYTFGAPIDKATTAIRNIGREKKGLPKIERTQLFNPIQHTVESSKGASKGVKEWALDIKNGVDTSPVGGGVELPTKVKIFNEDTGNAVSKTVAKAANKIHYVVGKALKLGDTPFYNAAYTSRIAELKKIKGTTVVTDAMKEDAMAFGMERTLQNDSGMSALFTGLKRADFLNSHPGAKATYQFVANLVLPFAKTPANILDKFLDYSPVGTVKAIGHAVGTAGKGTFNQKKFVDTLARSLTGTGLATVGYLMASKGLITGARDPNNKVESIETALGKQNYAFKSGDSYQTFDWALPAAAPLAMGADIYNAVNKTKEGQNAVLKGTESAINLLFNSTLLSGPSGFTGGYSPATAIGKGLLGTTTQATPTAGKQIAQLVDPYQRETYDPNTFKQTLNKTIARIPFASKSLPIKKNVLGEDVKAFQGKNNVFNVMFNPGFSTTYKPDVTQKEIIRLYQDSGQTSQLPSVVEKYIPETKDHPRINLTADEFTQYQKRTGQLTINGGSINGDLIPFNGFKNVMEQDRYKNAKATKDKTADEVRTDMLADVISKAKAQAKKEILEQRGYGKKNQVINSSLASSTYTPSSYKEPLPTKSNVTLPGTTNKSSFTSPSIPKVTQKVVSKTVQKLPTITKLKPKIEAAPIKKPYYGKGNVDLNDRPIIKNKDGSISTVFSMTFWPDETGEKKYILVPGVRKGLDRKMTNEEALAWYRKTGEYLGKFDSDAEAEKYAISLHEDQEKQYVK